MMKKFLVSVALLLSLFACNEDGRGDVIDEGGTVVVMNELGDTLKMWENVVDYHFSNNRLYIKDKDGAVHHVSGGIIVVDK